MSSMHETLLELPTLGIYLAHHREMSRPSNSTVRMGRLQESTVDKVATSRLHFHLHFHSFNTILPTLPTLPSLSILSIIPLSPPPSYGDVLPIVTTLCERFVNPGIPQLDSSSIIAAPWTSRRHKARKFQPPSPNTAQPLLGITSPLVRWALDHQSSTSRPLPSSVTMASAWTTAPVRFDIPPEARSLPRFAALPAELRYEIWEHAMLEPGMHFLKVVVDPDSAVSSDTVSIDSDISHGAQVAQQHPTDDTATAGHHPSRSNAAIRIRKAHLAPIYPHPRADLSRYVGTNHRLSTLSASCVEAAQVVRRLVHHPASIKLPDGNTVFLDRGSRDIICLDYMSSDRFYNGCRIRHDVQCPGLEGIRHLAIPYCHQWETKCNPCSRCHRQHDLFTERTYPVHVFQFLARQLPNLQTFYFIDYLILPKKSADRRDADRRDDDSNTSAKRRPHGFRSKDRTFFEVSSPNSDDWAVSSRVFQTLSWVQENFRTYAVRSTTTRYRHPNPHDVQFKVLACQWDTVEPRTAHAPMLNCPTAKKKTDKKRGFASACGENSPAGRALKTFKSARAARRQVVTATSATAVPHTVPFDTPPGMFVFGRGEKFDFVFGREVLVRR
ncbi:hypothetical protein SODALDRAFT_382004 [Sodiomyces alkalinus F11]|uniref:Uncharacterized protein n=1 Tax=Sodiomyces alkalinus (strain CBS 110278 / VKM F-3762 / F11) TaxID=1314773 RepID=A0A3N2PKX3_SODAK|nr:hypothetical protein SODALDRAFT_382004 [Sodiomyces alkalinus F11]ROT35064.1 hypothetical protein SODALDRAFT_382004 [Sodiomyces alkalinus F11]